MQSSLAELCTNCFSLTSAGRAGSEAEDVDKRLTVAAAGTMPPQHASTPSVDRLASTGPVVTSMYMTTAESRYHLDIPPSPNSYRPWLGCHFPHQGATFHLYLAHLSVNVHLPPQCPQGPDQGLRLSVDPHPHTIHKHLGRLYGAMRVGCMTTQLLKQPIAAASGYPGQACEPTHMLHKG
jgi:hypothetical protein